MLCKDFSLNFLVINIQFSSEGKYVNPSIRSGANYYLMPQCLVHKFLVFYLIGGKLSGVKTDQSKTVIQAP